jgi:hypothetical protein
MSAALPYSRARALDIDFDHVLSILQSWLGHELLVNLEASHPRLHLASIRGPLAAAPANSVEFAFTLGTGSFSIREDCFAGACFYPDADHLTISIDDRNLPAHQAAFTLNILRQI